ncbi:hypothetical protein GE253_13115 [Niveispirillum sp. SYP-B3756]|uniref:hypothetical protein n=1 Tax=Niveispirillum sp. SYP-B3756 TaxID=2662178 RepID=UPI0012923E32|nr:hypothetical protein [Niveispirillum sp. SYP-B3756]MQP66281.1 hypothetical protein [Niveispirillum sp. SYP-B3756]
MQVLDFTVEENGIVIFDKNVVKRFYGSKIKDGDDLLNRFMTSDEGDDALKNGLIVPVLAIDDMGYDIIIKMDNENCPEESFIIFSNGTYPLHIEEFACIYDLYSIMHWSNESEDGVRINIEKGYYGVNIHGYRIDDENGHIKKAGYIFSFKKESDLPKVTGETGSPMRVIDL